MNREEIKKQIISWQSEGLKVGFTSGTFDLLHFGHITYLTEAKNRCDKLVVAVNSDSSVRKYKSELRPIVFEKSRLAVIKGLKPVDAAFIFNETNNNKNINELKPDVYIKAGDYDISKLSSAPLVQSYGGSIEIIKFEDGFSSSDIIDRVLDVHGAQINTSPVNVAYEKKPAIFFDRDGTLNEHVEYLHEPEKFKLIEGAAEALKNSTENGFKNIIVTNQAGIGLGYFTKEDFYRVNRELFKAVSKEGAFIDKIYFSPHSKSDDTNCRKPNIGMIERAVADLNIDLENSFVVGDMTGDIQLAKNAGCKSVLVKTGKGGEDGVFEVTPDFAAKDVKEAVEIIVRNCKKL
jgi:D-glycero-D-manno-heptose 1,7-bisphosphate phosphatase